MSKYQGGDRVKWTIYRQINGKLIPVNRTGTVINYSKGDGLYEIQPDTELFGEHLLEKTNE